MGTLHPLLALRRALSRLSQSEQPIPSDAAPDGPNGPGPARPGPVEVTPPAPATEVPRASPDDPLETAIALCLANNWDEARDVLRRLSALTPNSARTWRALGLAQGRLGEWRRAQDALERAERLESSGPAADLLAEVRAVRKWSRAIARRPWDVEARVQLGALMMAWERGDEALDHLRRAVTLKPDWAPAQLYLGLELHYRGQVDEAELAYAEAVRLAPEDETARRYLEALKSGLLPGEDEQKASPDPWSAALAS